MESGEADFLRGEATSACNCSDRTVRLGGWHLALLRTGRHHVALFIAVTIRAACAQYKNVACAYLAPFTAQPDVISGGKAETFGGRKKSLPE